MRKANKLSEARLRELYLDRKLPVSVIANRFSCSESKINYWLKRFDVPKRSISEAQYLKLNPSGNPFNIRSLRTHEDAFILGLGLGLFWGEGNKRNESSVRLGNSDPALIRAFLFFMQDRYEIEAHRLKFSLQLFSDMDVSKEERFWKEYLGLKQGQMYKTTVSISGKMGTYREKSKHGVLTVYFHNKKLRDHIAREIDNLKHIDYSCLVLPKEEKPM